MSESTGQRWGRRLLGAVFVIAGVLHGVRPDAYAGIVPAWLPAPLLLVWLSGAAEVLGGVGVWLPWPRVRVWAGAGLAALLVAVFPANVQMALDGAGPGWVLWGRLPVQGALVAWALRSSGALAYWMRSKSPGQATSASPMSYGA